MIKVYDITNAVARTLIHIPVTLYIYIDSNGSSGSKEGSEIYPRKVGEAISFSFGAMANLMQYPLGKA